MYLFFSSNKYNGSYIFWYLLNNFEAAYSCIFSIDCLFLTNLINQSHLVRQCDFSLLYKEFAFLFREWRSLASDSFLELKWLCLFFTIGMRSWLCHSHVDACLTNHRQSHLEQGSCPYICVILVLEFRRWSDLEINDRVHDVWCRAKQIVICGASDNFGRKFLQSSVVKVII